MDFDGKKREYNAFFRLQLLCFHTQLGYVECVTSFIYKFSKRGPSRPLTLGQETIMAFSNQRLSDQGTKNWPIFWLRNFVSDTTINGHTEIQTPGILGWVFTLSYVGVIWLFFLIRHLCLFLAWWGKDQRTCTINTSSKRLEYIFKLQSTTPYSTINAIQRTYALNQDSPNMHLR